MGGGRGEKEQWEEGEKGQQEEELREEEEPQGEEEEQWEEGEGEQEEEQGRRRRRRWPGDQCSPRVLPAGHRAVPSPLLFCSWRAEAQGTSIAHGSMASQWWSQDRATSVHCVLSIYLVPAGPAVWGRASPIPALGELTGPRW